MWSPIKIGDIIKLESIQRSFTSRIRIVCEHDYWDRLVALSLYSLQRRRDRYMAIYVWKIGMGMVPNFNGEELKIKFVGEGTRVGKRCALPPLSRNSSGNTREKSFVTRGPIIFNSLPKILRKHEGSLETYKVKLDRFLEDIPDKPPVPGYRDAAEGNSLPQQIAHLRAQQL